MKAKKHARISVKHLELKVCENCAVLWLRPMGSERRYCLACTVRMEQVHLVPEVQIERKNKGWKCRKEAA